jgi:hypothetical protein
MTLRCDHCRGVFGPRIHRYWQMRFCSAACVTAYQDRLGEGTRVKIQHLAGRRQSAPHRNVSAAVSLAGGHSAG